nr:MULTISPECIES: DUF2804 domain-containing protein [unclassified Microbacterium]
MACAWRHSRSDLHTVLRQALAHERLVIESRTDQLFGVWTGWALDDTGTRVHVDGIEGFAEEVLNRW